LLHHWIGTPKVVTLTEIVAWCVNASLTVIVHAPAATDVTGNAPFVSAPNVAIPLHPLIVMLMVPGSVTVTVCVCAVPLNVSAAGETASGPADAVGEGARLEMPVMVTGNDEECPWSSLTMIVALPFATAVIVKVPLPSAALAPVACVLRMFDELCSVAGETVAMAVFDDDAVYVP
jgi:hypothetical protein